MIEYEQVTRCYGTHLAVSRLDLKVPGGELFALLGHNGAGKTTTIKMLVGLLRPSSGSVRVGGNDVVRNPRHSARLLGYVPDEPFLYEKLTGREFLQFVVDMYGLDGAQGKQAIEREIMRFELAGFVDSLSETYSHGMKQRTVFAAALLHDPAVLVVDEPMVGLDPHSMRLVKDLLRDQARAGKAVFMSTHTLGIVEQIADRIGIMDHGHLIFLGTLSELRSHLDRHEGDLESLYLELTEQHRAVRHGDPGAERTFTQRPS